MRAYHGKPTILALCVLLGCAGSSIEGTDPVDSEDPTRLVSCPAERHEMCTQDYQPVCGRIGASDEWKTYSNGCTACTEPKVSGFRPAPCPAAGE